MKTLHEQPAFAARCAVLLLSLGCVVYQKIMLKHTSVPAGYIHSAIRHMLDAGWLGKHVKCLHHTLATPLVPQWASLTSMTCSGSTGA